jgi:hypothetical protein
MIHTNSLNNTYWTDFQNRLKEDKKDMTRTITNLQEMTRDCVSDYKINQDAQRTHLLIETLDKEMGSLFDCLSTTHLDDEVAKQLTHFFKEFNEDKKLREIRENIAHEGIHKESTNRYTTRGSTFKTHATIRTFSGSPNMNQRRSIRNSPNENENEGDESVESIEDDSNEAGNFPENEHHEINEEDLIHEIMNGVNLGQKENMTESPDLRRGKQSDDLELVKVEVDNQENDHLQDITNIIELHRQTSTEQHEKEKEKFFELLGNMRGNFDEHRIEEAYEAKIALINYINERSSDPQLKELFDLYLKANSGCIFKIDYWYKEIQRIVEQFDEEEGYHQDVIKKRYSLKSKTFIDGRTVFKIESTLDVPLINILSLVRETNGFNRWVPFVKNTVLTKQLDRATSAYWVKCGRLAPRECHCVGIAVDRLQKNGSFLMISNSIDSNKELLKYYDINVPKKSKYVKMDFQVGTEIVALSENKTKVRIVFTENAHVQNTPSGILRWASRKATKYMFEKLMKKAKNMKGTLWESSIKENVEFYGWIEEKLRKNKGESSPKKRN